MLLIAPLFPFIRADYGVSYTELGLALTVFNVASAVLQTPVGFLVDRIGARVMLIAGLLLGAGAIAVAALVNSFWVFIAMFARDGRRQYGLPPGRLCAALRARRARAGDAGVLVPHLFRHARLRGRAGDACCSCRPGGLARRVSQRRPSSACVAALFLVLQTGASGTAPAAGAKPTRRRAGRARRPTAGGSCCRRRSCSISCSSCCSRWSAAGLNNFLVVGARRAARHAADGRPIPRSPACWR